MDYFVFTLDLNVEKATDYSFSNSLAKKRGNFDKSESATQPSKESSTKEKYLGTSLRNLRLNSTK